MWIVMTILDNAPNELVLLTENQEMAVDSFLRACNDHFAHWGTYTHQDIERVLFNGYEKNSHIGIFIRNLEKWQDLN